MFCYELSILLESGVSLPNSIDLLQDYFKDVIVKSSLKSIKEGLYLGQTLHFVINKYSFIYPTFLIEMIRIGEESGELPKILKKLSSYYKYGEEISKELKKSLSYPIIVLCVAISIISFLIFNILPKFIQLIESFKIPVSSLSKAMFSFVKYANSGKHYIAFILLGLNLYLLYCYKTSGEWKKIHNILINIPYLGKVYKKIQISRLFMAMGITFSSGMSILDSIEKSSMLIKNKLILKKIEEVRNSILKGQCLSKAFKKSDLFSESVNSIIAIGEEEGNLQDIFSRISERYKEDVLECIEKCVKYIEPIIIVIISILVGVITISILMPMLSLMDSLAI
ncbi:type II secretion system F family protein [Clostridium lundense]|uniref:type II secretion system F family protein n=1 Tax=Clostridium lundense TaxID=319475 RepID=UPI00048644C1|nr:type II secretion system F family protein [Clostridium lundense]